MYSKARTPEFLRQTNFQNQEASRGPFQYAEKTNLSLWAWLLEHPEINDAFNTFTEGARGDRTHWLDWFPVQDRLIDGFEDGVLITDLGGGRGHDLRDFAAKFPDAPGVLVLQEQAHVLAEAELGERVEGRVFDLFKPQNIQGKC